MFKKYGIPALITVVLGGLYFYLSLPVLNPKSASFWCFIIFLVAIFFIAKGVITRSIHLIQLLKGNVKPERIPFDFRNTEGEKRKKTIKHIVIIVGAVLLVFVCYLFQGFQCR